MREMLKGSIILVSAVITFMVLPGCTPGKAQTRGNDYKGSFETEEFEAFDGTSGDDEIPAYNGGKKVSSSGRGTVNQNEYDNNIASIKKDYDRNNSGAASYNEGNRNSYSDEATAAGYRGNNESYESDTAAAAGSDRFYQKGMASWYGREFHGRTTASGEKFDMNALTAAHKTLPFGTVVEVRNLENGKSVKLKINDRGPYRGNRIIDVSFEAAKELNMLKAGEAKVGINVLRMGDKNGVAEGDYSTRYVEPVSDDTFSSQRVKGEAYVDSDSSVGLKLQAGAFYSRNNAEGLKSKIENLTDRPVKIVQDGEFFKVRVEGLRNKNELKQLKSSLENESISSFTVE